MSNLIQSPNLRDPDGFYASLVVAHRDLTAEDSELLNARLVLILANHIGDPAVLMEALDLARAFLSSRHAPPPAKASIEPRRSPGEAQR